MFLLELLPLYHRRRRTGEMWSAWRASITKMGSCVLDPL